MKIAVCDDEFQFIAAHNDKCMDLIILDVIMPLLKGMDTARELRSNDPLIPLIFLSSSREFAVDSYDVKAFHYLIKPVDREKLFTSF